MRKEKLVLKKKIRKFINKILIATIILLVAMISIKKNPELKSIINEHVYENSFKFTKAKLLYEKYFGNILSLDKVIKEEKPVFNEKISYEKEEKYNGGVKLKVNNNYMVPSIESGIIVFIGKKEKYGNTIIIEQIDGIDAIYGNINISNYKLYDYIEKGELLGETEKDILLLKFQSKGKNIDYKKYI